MGEDAELEEMIRANRRAGGRRLAVVGLVVTGVSAAIALYGHHLDVQQRGSRLQLTLPQRLAMFGVFGVVIGLLLMAAGVVMLVRGRRQS